MQNRLTELRRKRAAGESGFTLIELLVVVVIIGILIAIAIPVYLNYQKGAKDKSAASDLRNAISVFEQCNSDKQLLPERIGSGTGLACRAYELHVDRLLGPVHQPIERDDNGPDLTHHSVGRLPVD